LQLLADLPVDNTAAENATFVESTTPVDAAPAGENGFLESTVADSFAPSAVESDAHAPETDKTQPEQENRENLSVFKAWGTPAVRDKPGTTPKTRHLFLP
jgi:hypothetical protein